jgi:Flp pilus assembly protein TadD
MKRFSILFALVIAACGGDKAVNDNTRIDQLPPVVETPRAVPGFGSGDAGKSDVVDHKASKELPVVETWIPTKYSEAMSVGKEVAAKGDHARARVLFEAAAKLDRKAASPHVELARSYISTGERALAIRHASKATKLAPESSQAYNTLGRAELLRHAYDDAAIAFRQATELDPNNVWAWNNLGLVYMTQKNHVEAVNALVEATGRKGVEGYMWNNLGLAYEQLDKLDDARDAFDSGAKLGSVAAKASRKRLDGVDSVAIAKKDTAKDVGFETREPMPDLVDDQVPEPVIEDADEVIDVVIDETVDEVKDGTLEEGATLEEPKVDEPKTEAKPDETKVEEKSDEPKVEEKSEAPKVEPKST